MCSPKEGERSHQMELQQQAVTPGHLSVPAKDLTARGAIDLYTMTQVTSPVSSTDSEQEQHDDTGYSSAVSSIGSTTASPCPQGGAGQGGSGSEGDLSLLHSKPQVGPQLSSVNQTVSTDMQELGPGPQLGFHSTLSSAIYGEDFGVSDMTLSVDHSLAHTFCHGAISGSFNSDPPPSLSDDQSDPFLSGSGVGRGRGEGSLTHVMEDMELLEDLLERIGDCDNSVDSVFPSSPPSQRDMPTLAVDEHTPPASQSVTVVTAGAKDLVTANLKNNLTAGGKGGIQTQAQLFTLDAESQRQPSLLRTLLDKEGKELKDCPPVVEAWTKSFPAVTLSCHQSDMSTACTTITTTSQAERRGKMCAVSSTTKDRQSSSEEQVGRASSENRRVAKQLIVCDGKQVMVPVQVDLTQEEDEEGRGQGVSMDSDPLPPALPDDLLDFAMQYCDDLPGDRDTLLPESITGLDPDIWNSAVDEFMALDSRDPTPATPSTGKCRTGPPVTSTSNTTVVQHAVEKPKPSQMEPAVSSKVLAVSKGSGQPAKSASSKGSGQPAKSASSKGSGQPAKSASSPVVQSAVITSSQRQTKPAITISVQPVPPDGVKGVKIVPLAKDRTAAMLRGSAVAGKTTQLCLKVTGPVAPSKGSTPPCSKGPSPTSPKGANTAGSRGASPALSDHRYSTTRTHSPVSCSQPPTGKRMRTEWDRGAAGGGKSMGGDIHEATFFTSIPPCKSHVAHKQPTSPASGGSSPYKSGSSDCGGSSLPTSPFTPPIPANGGGKPLNAMSELEKHLRGLAAPPDERSKEVEDTLTPIEESCQAGSRPFLERLLTGEISHERYRQIDYHLLYEERERRMLENGKASWEGILQAAEKQLQEEKNISV